MGVRLLRGWNGVIDSLSAQEHAGINVGLDIFVRGMADLYHRHTLSPNTIANDMTQSFARCTRCQILLEGGNS